jgi:hypothetical protein
MDAERHDLVVEFVGDERTLSPGDELTFGRAADIVIDENRYLHRVVGRFRWSNGMWWLTNVGSSIPIDLADRQSTSFTKVAPGASVPISFESATLGFEAGGRPYELTIELLAELPELDHPPPATGDEVTTTAASIPLTDEQRLLLVALAEPRLRERPGGELPTNREIAAKLRWTITKYNRKLDGLCRKYSAAGVSGLRGTSDALARDRRVRLMEHALHAGIITSDDLALLDAATAAADEP